MEELKNQAEAEVEAIHLWATPRSLSTSLMYSFAHRDDTEVLDEPLYATFLQVTGSDRPYREEVLSKMPFPMSLYDVLEQSLPFYNFLRRHVRQTSSLLKSPLPEPDLPVPENKKLLAWVGDQIVPRESAKVSVFNSVVQGGDSVWEGLRV
ncbi:hypothetical protein ACFX15_010034 [Malus domestica]